MCEADNFHGILQSVQWRLQIYSLSKREENDVKGQDT